MQPVHRTTNESTLMLGSGEPLPQLKLTVASVRTSVGATLKVMFVNAVPVVVVQYWPKSPVPVPTVELLTKLALTEALSTAPALNAFAVTGTELEITNG